MDTIIGSQHIADIWMCSKEIEVFIQLTWYKPVVVSHEDDEVSLRGFDQAADIAVVAEVGLVLSVHHAQRRARGERLDRGTHLVATRRLVLADHYFDAIGPAVDRLEQFLDQLGTVVARDTDR